MSIPLVVTNLSFRYPEGPWLLRQVSLALTAGEVVAITGPSGCGKSTLCYCLCGIIPHIYEGELKGQVLVDDLDTQKIKINQLAGRLSMVFQEPANQLFAPSVEYELAFAVENLGWSRLQIEQAITDALATCGISHLRHLSPHRLSGGQQQLVALAAALATNPQVLLFDEALSQLDEESCTRIKDIIRQTAASGKAILMVEHQAQNLDVADRVLYLEDGLLTQNIGGEGI